MHKKEKIILVVIALLIVLTGFFIFRGNNAPSEWKTWSDERVGVEFKYPDNIPTKYIHTVDWPPIAQTMNGGQFNCTEAGSTTARAGQTSKRTINGRDYCISHISEGAAGSIYNQYAYATKVKDKIVFLAFSLRTVQCENYDEPEKTECKDEQKSFDLDSLMDEIMQTIEVN